MKKIVAIMFAGVALQAGAVGTIAPLSNPVKPAADNVTLATCPLLKTPFTFTQSANVGLAYDCDTIEAVVNAGNIKGKFTYGGSTNGGSVKQCVVGTSTADVSTTVGYKLPAPTLTADGCS